MYERLILLLVLPLFFPAMVLGMLTANIILFLVPPARRVLDLEAGSYKRLHYVSAQKVLLKVAGLALLVAVPVALFASCQMKVG
jgi:hypothetical protein